MQDLQRVLEKVVTEQAKKPLTRRFIITEGLFENVGDMIDLPKLVRSFYISAYYILAYSDVADRAWPPVQVPNHSGRDLVFRRLGQDWPRHHRAPKCGRCRS